MKTFLFKTQRTVERPLTEVFSFFSNAHNLAVITPPQLHLEVLTPAPIEMSRRNAYRLSAEASRHSTALADRDYRVEPTARFR